MGSGRSRKPSWLPLIAVLLSPSTTEGADPPWRIVSSDGNSSIQFGFLAQPQAEWLTTADGTDTARNLYLRRLRLIVGGKVNEKLLFFIETGRRAYGDPLLPGETRYQVGVTYWLSGHRLNLKMGAGQWPKDGAPGRTQVVLQGQVYFY